MRNSKKVPEIIGYLLALFCVLYGVLVLLGGSGTGFFLVWFVIAAFFLLLAVALHYHFFQKMKKGIRRCLAGTLSVFVLFFVITEGFVLSGFFMKERERLDYVIVLGVQVYETGPSRVLQYRLDRAIQYLNENPETVCIVSGGQGKNEPFAEAVGMSQYLVEHGIEEHRIILEDQSATTVQNIQFTKPLLEETASVGIITNNFHMFRACQVAKREGLSDASGIVAKSTMLYLPNNMLREFLAIMKFWICK